MTPEQRDFLEVIGNVSSILFGVAFLGTAISAIINYSERQIKTAKICAACSIGAFIIMSSALTLTFFSLG